MCGIFGLIAGNNSNFDTSLLEQTISRLFKLSESRGKEASGIAFLQNNFISVIRKPNPASDLIKEREYLDLFKRSIPGSETAIIGHTRLVTNGTITDNRNNQPVIKHGLVAIHNGIIVNDEKLWKKHPGLHRLLEVDTEVFLSLFHNFRKKTNGVIAATQKTYKLIEGSASMAILFNDLRYLLLATNTGSLYACRNKNDKLFIFASEYFFLDQLIRHKLKDYFPQDGITQIKPGDGNLININDLSVIRFPLNQKSNLRSRRLNHFSSPLKIDLLPDNVLRQNPPSTSTFNVNTLQWIVRDFAKAQEKINLLRRCSRCILPETMPFIEFDNEGVCNYCRNYKKITVKGQKVLEVAIESYRKKNGGPDCIIAFSGGRDSSYGLHYVKNVLKMNPVAYSYDWGMLTDLGRRNQARMCGKLGVEHILISADIPRKREYIRKNVEAWLKKPDLGTIPLFMAGDKQYFYYANKLMKQMNIKLLIMAENPLERTHFKHGFCGIAHRDSDKPPYFLSLEDKIGIALYYVKQFIANSSYLNSSLLDTFTAYLSYYMIPHNYLYLFQYLRWDEDTINKTLINKYNWELARDTNSTWRIGDGTASFYNYIYYTVAGFTENDTFCSNQIREGVLKRSEAVEKIKESNQPRLESMKWYCSTIGVDFEKAIKTINSIPKLYPFLAR